VVESRPADGITRFHLYQSFGGQPPLLIQRDLSLTEENNFLNLSDPPSPRGMDLNIGFYERTSANNPDDSNATKEKIMVFKNTSVLYLCREFIAYRWMYFVLRRPRSKSSLCTFGYIFIRPDAQLVLPPPLLEEANSLMTTAIQSTLPNYTQHSRSGDQNSAYQAGPSGSHSNQLVDDYSAHPFGHYPLSVTSSGYPSFQAYPHHYAQGSQISYPDPQQSLPYPASQPSTSRRKGYNKTSVARGSERRQ
jgi:hypothetical protein